MESIQKEFLPYVIVIMTLGIGVELLLSKEKGLNNYDKKESFISLTIFIIGTFIKGFIGILTGFVMLFAFEHRLFEFNLSPVSQFFVVFFLVEFFYYWMHRYSHTVHLGWATHIVHHSPECYNFSVAYRLGITGLFSLVFLFYVPIAWLGFDPKVIAAIASLNLLYQFWLHTELVPKLGWFELIFNTPSHHRVHHGSNPLYLDRNYGGTLIIFDRLFGTFQAEDSRIKIEYGLTGKLANKSVLKILFLGWVSLWQEISAQRRLIDKISIIFAPPGWLPEGGVTSETVRARWIEENQFYKRSQTNEN